MSNPNSKNQKMLKKSNPNPKKTKKKLKMYNLNP